MQIGLIISTVLHLGLLMLAFVHIQSIPEHIPLAPEPIAVEVATPDDITRLKKGDRDAKQLDAEAKESPKPEISRKEAPKPVKQAAAPPPPAAEPPPAAKEEVKPEPPKPAEPKPDPIADKLAALPKEPEPLAPAPGPTPDEQKLLEQKLEAERKAEEQKKAAELKKKQDDAKKAADAKKKADDAKKAADAKKKADDAKKAADAKKKQFNADKMAELLNKIPDQGGPAPSVEKSALPSKNKGPVAGAPEGRDDRLTASELAILRQMIKRCPDNEYGVLSGSSEREQLVFSVRVRLNPDGNLAGAPQVLNPQGSAFFLAASENAIRAISNCQPYQLPPDKYAHWKDVILDFGKK